MRRKPTLRINRSLATHAACSHRLSIRAIRDITRRKDAFDVRVTRARMQRHIARAVELDPTALQKLRCR